MARTGRPPQDELTRFWSKVNVKSKDECWEWQAAKYPNGYGLFRRGGRDGNNIGAHRLAYEISFGPFDNNLLVCHKCDNPSCVNPNHLFLGTQSDNMCDAIDKSRKIGTLQGGNCGGPSKLKDGELWLMRKLILAKIPRRLIAKIFKVSHGYPYHIKKKMMREGLL